MWKVTINLLKKCIIGLWDVILMCLVASILEERDRTKRQLTDQEHILIYGYPRRYND